MKTQEENCWNLVHWNRLESLEAIFKTSEELEAGLIEKWITFYWTSALPLISFLFKLNTFTSNCQYDF